MFSVGDGLFAVFKAALLGRAAFILPLFIGGRISTHYAKFWLF